MSNSWYPILFSLNFRECHWGGNLVSEHFGRPPPDSNSKIGEWFEIVDRENVQSVVVNGSLEGRSLRELVVKDSKGLVGNKHNPGMPFPLVMKYLDAGKRLPLQVHPDQIASLRLSGSAPNSKMWFVVASRPGAKILVGIKRNCTQQQFLSRLGTPDIESIIQSFPSEPGDAYFVAAGRVHGVDAGNLLFSVEQNSDTGFHLSDWGHSNQTQKTTSTNLESALGCIHFQDRTLARIRGESSKVNRNRKIPLLNTCPFFAIDDLRLVYELHDYTDGTSFHVLTAIDGPIVVSHKEVTVQVDMGRSCFIPAAMGQYCIETNGSPVRLLKTTLRTG